MLYGSPFVSISKEAREVAAKKYASDRRKKIAFISNNIANILILKFFIKMNRPKTEIQIFRTDKEALPWLEKGTKQEAS